MTSLDHKSFRFISRRLYSFPFYHSDMTSKKNWEHELNDRAEWMHWSSSRRNRNYIPVHVLRFVMHNCKVTLMTRFIGRLLFHEYNVFFVFNEWKYFLLAFNGTKLGLSRGEYVVNKLVEKGKLWYLTFYLLAS